MQISILKTSHVLSVFFAFVMFSCSEVDANQAKPQLADTNADNTKKVDPARAGQRTPIDTALYTKLMNHITNGDSTGRWPVKHEVPAEGAVLPFNRIIAYYGNLYSKQMGILGELPKDQMLKKLMFEVDKWQKADSNIKVIPALHYIAVTAQGSPGAGNNYRLRMPFKQIDTVIKWAAEINALVFIDIQVGHSTVEKEMPEFEKYLKMPNVHFGIDPEFYMKTKKVPGSVIGTIDAADINWATRYLADIAQKNNLPPKMLVIHRFTQAMVTNYKKIELNPYVQIIMDMDGWGTAPRKIGTYKAWIAPQPVQFTGFKIFYKNDTKRVNAAQEMQPEQVLKLKPQPIYIQYQ